MPDFKVFPLPDTAEGLVDAEILTWHIKPGDEVTVNQIIVEIETAKAAVELPCPWAGVVTELHAQPGQTVNVGEPIVTIDVDPGGARRPPRRRAQAETNGQAMLVGYGPKAATTKRRPRKSAAAPVAAGRPAPVVASGHQPPPEPIRCRTRRPRCSSRPDWCRWRSRRCASWPRTSASTCGRWPGPA